MLDKWKIIITISNKSCLCIKMKIRSMCQGKQEVSLIKQDVAKDLKGTSKYDQLSPSQLESKPLSSLVWIIAQSPNWSPQSCQSDPYTRVPDSLIKIALLLTTKPRIKSTPCMKVYLALRALASASLQTDSTTPPLGCSIWTTLDFLLFPYLARLIPTFFPFAQAFCTPDLTIKVLIQTLSLKTFQKALSSTLPRFISFTSLNSS